MANQFYPHGLKHFALGDVLWKATGGSTIKGILVDTADYTVNFSTDEDLADVPAAARVDTATLTLIDAASGGQLDAQDTTFDAVTGDQLEAIVIYLDSGVEATSWLLIYIDTATGLPFTPNSGDALVTWPAPIATL